MLRIKRDTNQQYLEIVELHFVKSELFSPTSVTETQLQVGEIT